MQMRMRRVAAIVAVLGLAMGGCQSAARPARRTAVPAVSGTAAAAPASRAEPLVPPTNLAEKRQLFASAHALIEAGNGAAARPRLELLLLPAYPELADYVLFDLARANASNDPTRASALYGRLLETQPGSVLAAQAALARGRLLAGSDADAATRLLDAARDSGDDSTAMAASLGLADLALASGNRSAAYAHLSAARRVAPGTPLARQAKQRLLTLRREDPTLAPSGAELQQELTLLMAEQDYAAAEQTAEVLLTSAPPGDQPRLLRARAEALRGAGQFDAALAVLRDVTLQYPQSPEAAEAQFRLASLLWNRDRNAEADVEFTRFAARYRGHARSPEVLYALARIDQSDGRDAAAIAAYRRVIDAYPGASQSREARWRIGWIRYQAGDWNDAAAAFAAAAQGRDAAAAPDVVYWQARALERAGDRAAAARLYRAIIDQAPANYYALWASRRLGEERSATAALPAPPPTPVLGAVPSGTAPYHWDHARELAAAGLRPLARRELRAYERANAGDSAAAAALPTAYQAAGGYRDAIRLANARGGSDPAIFYPLAFWPQVSSTAAAEQVDPLLVLALMRQESLFDPAARSPADARGLMQLLPSTAERVARGRGQAPPTDQLTDVDVNIGLGTAYLAALLNEFDRDPQKALAAYNGGEEAVGRWQQRFGGLDGDEWVESITYRETRDYVKKVMGNYQRYRQLYAP
ncbi:MAG: transglycosylase SLT domain-containing protein [bacterium]